MSSKRRSRLVEWGKNLLILLLAMSLVYLLGRTQLSGKIADGLRDLLDGNAGETSGTLVEGASAVKIHPMRLAIYQDGQRYGVQYDQETVDSDFADLSILFTEALSSAGSPERVSEQAWRSALCSTGVYVDFHYAIPLKVLTAWLEDTADGLELPGSARRLCLAVDAHDGVSLFYQNAEDGDYYTCKTTLTREIHLDDAVADWPPNGARFAFEVANMSETDPYTLLTTTPQPMVYAAANPLLEDTARVDGLLATLDFPARGTGLNPAVGGQWMEGNDSLRLSADGVVTFHTIGDSDSGFRFAVPDEGVVAALEYVQSIVEDTAGAWCGQARLGLTSISESANGLEIKFQYCLNGTPVTLTDDRDAARFVVRDGVITDFTICLRSYAELGETSLVLPVVQAAAALESLQAQGKELTLVYQDSGGEQVRAGWIAA